jgi:hypothetical protein
MPCSARWTSWTRSWESARADPSASPPAGDDACSFPSAACGWRRPARTGRAPHDRPSGVLGGSVSALRRGTGRRRCSRVRKAATGSRRTLSPGFVPPLRVKTSCPGAQFLRFRARRGAKMSSSPWPPNALRRHHMPDDGIRYATIMTTRTSTARTGPQDHSPTAPAPSRLVRDGAEVVHWT